MVSNNSHNFIIKTGNSKNDHLNYNSSNTRLKALYNQQKSIWNGKFSATKYTVPHVNKAFIKKCDEFNIKCIQTQIWLIIPSPPRPNHIRGLPIICYPTIMVIYPYPLFGVILMVILHIIIIKINLNCSQIITLNSHYG